MSLVPRPAPNTRRVAPGDRIRVDDQNSTRAALLAVQALQNALVTGNVRPWSETMLHVVKVVQGDYLECVRLWRNLDEGTETVYVAKPALLRQSLVIRGGVTYVYTDSQHRTASKSGETDETQIVTPEYLVGDIIEVSVLRGLTGITEVDEQRGRPLDKNADGRAWATVPP